MAGTDACAGAVAAQRPAAGCPAVARRPCWNGTETGTEDSDFTPPTVALHGHGHDHDSESQPESRRRDGPRPWLGRDPALSGSEAAGAGATRLAVAVAAIRMPGLWSITRTSGLWSPVRRVGRASGAEPDSGEVAYDS